METGLDLRRIALSLEGTTEHPHFGRTAFKVVRTYATMAADGTHANIKFTPDQQAFKSMIAPDVFVPVPNGWGRNGWTTVELARLDAPELAAVLESAWALGRGPKAAGSRKTRD